MTMLQRIPKHVRVTGEERTALARQMKVFYENGASIRDLAAKLGRSYGFVYGLLREADTPLRGRGNVRRGPRTRRR